MIPHTRIIRGYQNILFKPAQPNQEYNRQNTTRKVIEEDFIIARKVFDGTFETRTKKKCALDIRNPRR